MKTKDFIKKRIRLFLIEEKAYDELMALKKWYNEEKDKIDKIKNLKKWKLKSDLLFKQYMNKKSEIEKKKNPYGLKGDIKANFIYHYTDGNSLIGIINDNAMIGSDEGISFTTHPNLYKREFVFWHSNKYSKGRHYGNIGVKMKFDFNKMKNDGLKFKIGSEDLGTYAGEDEIRLLKNELNNPLKYLVEIIIFKDKEDNYLELSKLLNSKNIKHKIV